MTGMPWIACSGLENYPVVSIDIQGQKANPRHMVFDTGAGHSYISAEYLSSVGVPLRGRVMRIVERNVGVDEDDLTENAKRVLRIKYMDVLLQVTISDTSSSIAGKVPFRAVHRWAESTLAFHCPFGNCEGSIEYTDRLLCGSRFGIISADALSHLRMSLVVDGTALTTRLTQLDPHD